MEPTIGTWSCDSAGRQLFHNDWATGTYDFLATWLRRFGPQDLSDDVRAHAISRMQAVYGEIRRLNRSIEFGEDVVPGWRAGTVVMTCLSKSAYPTVSVFKQAAKGHRSNGAPYSAQGADIDVARAFTDDANVSVRVILARAGDGLLWWENAVFKGRDLRSDRALLAFVEAVAEEGLWRLADPSDPIAKHIVVRSRQMDPRDAEYSHRDGDAGHADTDGTFEGLFRLAAPRSMTALIRRAGLQEGPDLPSAHEGPSSYMDLEAFRHLRWFSPPSLNRFTKASRYRREFIIGTLAEIILTAAIQPKASSRLFNIGRSDTIMPIVQSAAGHMTFLARWWGDKNTARAAINALLAILRPNASRILWCIIWNCRRLIDPVHRSRMHALKLTGATDVNWLVAEGDADLALRRRQALEAFPLFATIIVPDHSGVRHDDAEEMWDTHVADTAAVVDQGRPLTPHLATLFHTEDAIIRRFQGYTLQRLGCNRFGIRDAIKRVRHVSKDRHPWLKKDWEAFNLIYKTLTTPVVALLQKHRSDLPVSSSASLDTKCNQGIYPPEAMSYLLNRSFKPGQASVTATKIMQGHNAEGIVDMVNALLGQLVIPHMLRHENLLPQPWTGIARKNGGLSYSPLALRITAASLLGNRDISHLAENSAQWHNRVIAMNDALRPWAGDIASLSCWPPLVDRAVVYGSLHLHCLTTPGDLQTEGRQMHHCVGGYTTQCLIGGSHIVSLRTDAGEPVSTAEIRLLSDKERAEYAQRKRKPVGDIPIVEIIQHQGPNDGKPKTAATHSLTRFIADINSGVLTIDRAGLLDALENRRRTQQKDLVEQAAGYDVKSDDGLNMAWQQWMWILPKSLRRSHDEFVATIADEIRRHRDILADEEAKWYRSCFNQSRNYYYVDDLVENDLDPEIVF